VSVGVAKAVATGLTSADPPGTVKTVTEAGVAVATSDEDVIVQKVWVDGRYRKPAEALSH
jgi:hypothetical protein